VGAQISVRPNTNLRSRRDRVDPDGATPLSVDTRGRTGEDNQRRQSPPTPGRPRSILRHGRRRMLSSSWACPRSFRIANVRISFGPASGRGRRRRRGPDTSVRARLSRSPRTSTATRCPLQAGRAQPATLTKWSGSQVRARKWCADTPAHPRKAGASSAAAETSALRPKYKRGRLRCRLPLPRKAGARQAPAESAAVPQRQKPVGGQPALPQLPRKAGVS
jgi:hypothetical protein